VAPRAVAPYLAGGVHLGYLLVCISAAVTQQTAEFPRRAWIPPLAVGLALVLAFLATRGRIAFARWGRLLLALGIGLAFSLTYDPQLADLPGLGWVADTPLGQLNPSLAALGSVLVLVFWLATAAAGGERMQRPVPFRRALTIGAALVVVTGALTRSYLAGYYEGVSDTFETYDLMQRALQYTILIGAALGLSGARGVRGWPHLYVGLALLAGFARNMMQ